MPGGGRSHSCNEVEQVLVLTEGGFGAVVARLFGSSEGEPRESLAISPVLSFTPSCHALEGVESGSSFSVKRRKIKYDFWRRFIFQQSPFSRP